MKTFSFNFSPKTTPFPHQIEAIRFIEEHDQIALFDEQGLGKTKIVIEGLCNDFKNHKIESVLIVCKKNLIQTWCEEIITHSFLQPVILRGTENEIGMNFMTFSHFYIINYDIISRETERLKLFLNLRKFAIVLDESHTIKSPSSKVSISLHYLSRFASKKIIVSGTPVANKPIDLWSQYYFLDGGKLLGKSFKEFKGKYIVDLRETNSLLYHENFEKLRSTISEHSIRRKKADVLELPNKIFYDKYVELKGKQKELYKTLKNELVIEIQNEEGNIILDDSNEILKKLLRLEQICSNPYLIDKSYNETPAKFPLLIELVTSIINRDEKVIIWSSFVENIRLLNNLFKAHYPVMIYGEIPIVKRNEYIKRFKNDKDCKILIANPAAAREGLTLTVANNAIYLDRNFNLVDYLQSQDRIHRISQTKICNIYKLICKNTIDVYVDEIITRKHYLAELVQGDKQSIDFNYNLTKENILQFLRED